MNSNVMCELQFDGWISLDDFKTVQNVGIYFSVQSKWPSDSVVLCNEDVLLLQIGILTWKKVILFVLSWFYNASPCYLTRCGLVTFQKCDIYFGRDFWDCLTAGLSYIHRINSMRCFNYFYIYIVRIL